MKPKKTSLLAAGQLGTGLLSAGLLAGCGGENAPSNVQAPGGEKTAKTEVLEAGAAMLQNKAPLDALNVYLDGFHFYNGNMKGQMDAHHYCTDLNEEVTQCVIYDSNTEDAKIMGVEYIISARLFESLPEEEKQLWHSHVYEVKSGTLIAPGLPQLAEHELMEKIVSTYGKTWHTWHTDQDKELPLGFPHLMMAFTKDAQIDEEMVAARDKRFGVSTAEKRENRADIKAPPIAPEADAWEKGKVVQLQRSTLRNAGKGESAPQSAADKEKITTSSERQ